MVRPWICLGFVLMFPWSVGAEARSWPGLYRNLPKSQGGKVLELWGHPEPMPAPMHAAAFSRDATVFLYADGGAIGPDAHR